jgi:predicted metalloprotease
MRWQAGDRDNIEDERGNSGGGGGFAPMGLGPMHLGIGGLLLLLVLSWLSGTNLFTLLDTGGAPAGVSAPGAAAPSTPAEERRVDFVDAVARDVQDTWASLLGERYRKTRVVLFRDVYDSGCGTAESASGPFYCPADRLVYLDLAFFDELSNRFKAPGDFAQAYVIAHELGHHVQNLLGLSAAAARDRRTGENSASVALELQADCLAGVWGHVASEAGRFQTGHVELDPGDAEAGLRAAAAVGDDRLQRMTSGRVMPDRFTHGSSEQRMTWFRRGMDSGDPQACMGRSGSRE